MKKTVFLKSTLRQFGRSLFLLLLIGVISFTFVSRVGEVLLIERETTQLSGYYRAIGLVSSAHGNWGISDRVAEYLEQSPYVAYIDRRLSTSGVLQDGLYNSNTDGFYNKIAPHHNSADQINPMDVFFYGTFIKKDPPNRLDLSKDRYAFRVDEVLSGYPEYITPDKVLILNVGWKQFGDTYTQLEEGKRYLLRANYDPPGRNFAWKLLASDLPWFISAETNIDLSLPEYARFAGDLKQSHDNACSLYITATADMSSMPRFLSIYNNSQEEHFYLVDGRWLNYEDHLTQNRAIVVHEEFAVPRGLNIGDTVAIKLRNTPIAQSDSAWRGFQTERQPMGREEIEPNQTETFEIVGIYNSMGLHLAGGIRSLYAYIPLSVFPESFTRTIPDDAPDSCSLVLSSPADEEAFQEATKNDLAMMGYYVTFLENGYPNFKRAADGISTAARSNVIIFAVILAVCLCLACFVYFRFRRKDIAISRALGIPAGKCMIASALPLILVGGVGIVVGSALAWVYTQGNAETLLAALVEAAGAEGAAATLPINTLVILDVILIAALLVLALIFATVTVKKPVLSQLQGGRNKR